MKLFREVVLNEWLQGVRARLKVLSRLKGDEPRKEALNTLTLRNSSRASSDAQLNAMKQHALRKSCCKCSQKIDDGLTCRTRSLESRITPILIQHTTQICMHLSKNIVRIGCVCDVPTSYELGYVQVRTARPCSNRSGNILRTHCTRQDTLLSCSPCVVAVSLRVTTRSLLVPIDRLLLELITRRYVVRCIALSTVR